MGRFDELCVLEFFKEPVEHRLHNEYQLSSTSFFGQSNIFVGRKCSVLLFGTAHQFVVVGRVVWRWSQPNDNLVYPVKMKRIPERIIHDAFYFLSNVVHTVPNAYDVPLVGPELEYPLGHV